MTFGTLDLLIFLAFVALVLYVGLSRSRNAGDSGQDYFLAGRGLPWWLIGFSLIAANISTEQFVGMSGNAASHVGLAIASYEWMAAITLVVVAFAFLPYFLRAGIYTMPEFLEVRFTSSARTLMAATTIFIYLLLLGAVTYSGALTIGTLASLAGYSVGLLGASAAIGVIAVLYVATGGLKAAVWADLIQGSALILAGLIITVFAFIALGSATDATRVVDVATGAIETVKLAPEAGAMTRFLDLNANRLNMFLPASDRVLPWTALLLGLWIPNFYYWGLNQYITQRTLGSASLAEGQRGIVFASVMKLILPLGIVIPGLIAFNLYAGQMQVEAGNTNAAALAQYTRANPATQFVEVREQPVIADLQAWPEGRYLVAVHADAAALRAARTAVRNPFVVQLTAAEYAAATPPARAVFTSEDLAFASVSPGLAAEMRTFNEAQQAAATSAGQSTAGVPVIAYKYDTALALMLGGVLPQGVGIIGFIIAALLGAVVSSLAAMLNAASTIFTMDLYQRLLRPGATQKQIVSIGRISTFVFAGVAILLAPQLGNPAISNSIFTIIQEGQGFISPGVLAVFAFGILVRRAPRISGLAGLVTNIIAYPALKFIAPDIQFLNRMAICFAAAIAVMTVLTVIKPMAQPMVFSSTTSLNLESSRGARTAGIAVVIVTVLLYVIFSPLGVAR
jgi:SSS family solute:Na+ symporter